MSIINQALKKAQRDRLLHDGHTVPDLAYLRPAQPSRQWLFMTLGFVVALGAGALFRVYLQIPVKPSSVNPLPQAARQPTPLVGLSKPPQSPAEAPSLPPLAARPPLSEALHSRTPTAPVEKPVQSLIDRYALREQGSVKRPLAHESQQPADATPVTDALTPPSRPAPLQARDLLTQAIELQKTEPSTQVEALLQQAVSLDPELKEGYNRLGNLYYQQHNYHQALAMYQQALAIDPDYAKARNNLGSTYLRLAMDERAREELHKALQVDNTYGLAYYNLACVYARAGDSSMAVQYLQQAIALEPQARAWAQTDDDFTRVRATPEMRHLLGPS